MLGLHAQNYDNVLDDKHGDNRLYISTIIFGIFILFSFKFNFFVIVLPATTNVFNCKYGGT